VKHLLVYLHGQPAGMLEQDNSGLLLFQYSHEWLQRPDAIPLSRSLPLREEPFRGKHARPFFAGILPDEAPREQVARILGVSDRNDFALLERIGGECAGAVTLLPEDTPYPTLADTRTRQLTQQELEQVVAELPRRPLLAGTEGVRLSLAGSQSKLPVVLHGSTVELPLGNTPSTHILKPEPERFPGLVANEMLCMTLARKIGLNVPSVSTRTIGNKPCILVQRYDRDIRPDGTVLRIHQEDFCQALGIPPEHKYQQEGGPLLRDCITLLREWSTVPALDIPAFLDAVIFNVLIGNADAHGKNYSILYRQNQRRLAPLYDLVCTLAWPELSKMPAMKIGKSDSIETITPEHWQKLAAETQTSWPLLRERIGHLSERTMDALASDDVRAATDGAMFEKTKSLISERASWYKTRISR